MLQLIVSPNLDVRVSFVLDSVRGLLDWDACRQQDIPLLATSKLSEFSLSPTPQKVVLGYSQREESATADLTDWLVVEVFDVLRSRSNLDTLRET